MASTGASLCREVVRFWEAEETVYEAWASIYNHGIGFADTVEARDGGGTGPYNEVTQFLAAGWADSEDGQASITMALGLCAQRRQSTKRAQAHTRGPMRIWRQKRATTSTK